MINRRQFLGTAIIPLTSSSLAFAATNDITPQLKKIEATTGGRLGVSVLDTSTGKHAGLREQERFAMCSTFKFLAAAFVLHRVDQGQETLERRFVFQASELMEYSPGTKEHAGGTGMSMAELCEAAITLSDNTAANLILASFGGPAGLTTWLRSIGDKTTRLDRNEPSLNEARPGDPRDTSSPAAMVATMQKILLGDGKDAVLSAASRATLMHWLDGNTTGDARIRAGVPKDWLVGDKTGTGERNTSNDIAIIRPSGRAPILLCVYLTNAKVNGPQRDAAIAAVAKTVAAWAQN
jgi:beta-lactamase class A